MNKRNDYIECDCITKIPKHNSNVLPEWKDIESHIDNNNIFVSYDKAKQYYLNIGQLSLKLEKNVDKLMYFKTTVFPCYSLFFNIETFEFAVMYEFYDNIFVTTYFFTSNGEIEHNSISDFTKYIKKTNFYQVGNFVGIGSHITDHDRNVIKELYYKVCRKKNILPPKKLN